MPSVSIDCRFCKTSIVSQHYLTHILSKHKEPFIELFKVKFHSESYDSKPIRLEISPGDTTFPYYCCMGCLTACKAEGAARKHFDKQECKTKHLEFLLDVRHKYPKEGPKPSALALNPSVVRYTQKLIWGLLQDIKERDKDFNYELYKFYRSKIPFALDEKTLQKLYGREESDTEDEVKEKKEEVDTGFMQLPVDPILTDEEKFYRHDEEARQFLISDGIYKIEAGKPVRLK